MRRLLLPLFIFRLLLSLVPFGFAVIWLVISPFIGFTLLLSLFFLYGLLFSRQLVSKTAPLSSTPQSPTFIQLQQQIISSGNFQLWYQDDPALLEQKNRFTDLAESNQTNRDVLINAAILAESAQATSAAEQQQNNEQAQKWYKLAQYADPNHPFVR